MFAWKRKNGENLYWDDVDNYNNRYLKGLPIFIKNNINLLSKYVEKIQNLPSKRIEQLIENSPSHLLDQSQKHELVTFLTSRKKRLQQITELWNIKYKVK